MPAPFGRDPQMGNLAAARPCVPANRGNDLTAFAAYGRTQRSGVETINGLRIELVDAIGE